MKDKLIYAGIVFVFIVILIASSFFLGTKGQVSSSGECKEHQLEGVSCSSNNECNTFLTSKGLSENSFTTRCNLGTCYATAVANCEVRGG